MGFTKIQDSDLVDIGVIGLPDTPGLSTAAMQNKLEETSRSVVIPKHNALIDELEATTAAASIGMSAPSGREGTTVQAVVSDISSDLATVESEIGTVVAEAHTHDNKTLLDTYDQTNADIAQAITDDHTHSNKALLDTYTQSESDLADAVSKKHSHANKALLDTYEQTEANIADAVSKKHSHSNKALLDTYTQTESDLASAVADDHTHSNKSLLDSYTQTESDLSDAVSKKHSHSNKAVLDKFSESGGLPLYDGSAFAGDMLQSQYDSDGDVATAGGIVDYVAGEINGKADKVSSATNGNFAGLDSNGNLTDSGSKASDFLTQHQDISGKQDKTLSAQVEGQSTVEGALGALSNADKATRQLIDDTVGWTSKNYIKEIFLVDSGQTKQSPYTKNGVTFTINDDNTITVDTNNQPSTGIAQMIVANVVLPRGEYILNGTVGGSASTYNLRTDNSHVDNGNGVEIISDGTTKTIVALTVFSGVTLNNVIFYPMISKDGGAYEPYHPSVDSCKADISAIGDDESGRTTASRQYSAGEYFYKDGQNCRTKTTVASGATWTLGTNYEVVPIDSALVYKTGDTYTATSVSDVIFECLGHLSTNSKQIILAIDLQRPILKNPSISYNGHLVVRNTNGYTDFNLSSNYTISCYVSASKTQLIMTVKKTDDTAFDFLGGSGVICNLYGGTLTLEF